MPKTTTWTGATDSDFDVATNWSNGLPTSTDTAVVDGSVNITGGSVTNDTIERFYVASTYTGSIGSTGTPLELDVAQLSIDSNANSAIQYVHLTGTTNTTPTAMIAGVKTGTAIYLSGDLDLVIVEDGFAGLMYLGNSAAKVADIKDLVMRTTTGSVDASNADNVAWVSSATINMSSGTLQLGENIGTNSSMIVSGGTVNVTGWTATTGDTFTIQGGGTVNWSAGSAGVSASAVTTVRTVNLIDGTFTTAANENAYVGLNDINQYGGTLNLKSSVTNIDINGTHNAYSGTFVSPKQSTITTSAK